MSDSLRLQRLQHSRLPGPSLSAGVCSDSCSLHWWCLPTISPSVTPISSCLQSFTVSESFPMSQLFPLSCQSIGASASASVLPTNHSVQSLSHVWLFATPWTAARQASLSITNSRSLLKLMSIKLAIPSNHLILCHPFLLPPSIFPSIWDQLLKYQKFFIKERTYIR